MRPRFLDFSTFSTKIDLNLLIVRQRPTKAIFLAMMTKTIHHRCWKKKFFRSFFLKLWVSSKQRTLKTPQNFKKYRFDILLGEILFVGILSFFEYCGNLQFCTSFYFLVAFEISHFEEKWTIWFCCYFCSKTISVSVNNWIIRNNENFLKVQLFSSCLSMQNMKGRKQS